MAGVGPALAGAGGSSSPGWAVLRGSPWSSVCVCVGGDLLAG